MECSRQISCILGIPGPVLLAILHNIKILDDVPVMYESSLRYIWDLMMHSMLESDPHSEVRFKQFRTFKHRVFPRFLVPSADCEEGPLYNLNLLACLLDELSVIITEESWDAFLTAVLSVHCNNKKSAETTDDIGVACTQLASRTPSHTSMDSMDTIDSRDTVIFDQMQTLEAMLGDKTELQEQNATKDQIIAELQKQKKLLQQKVRRLSSSLNEANKKECENTSASMSLERVGKHSDGKKWRWLTPAGCVNAAVPW
jgi:hypothetical protein